MEYCTLGDSLWGFLQQIKGQIVLSNPWKLCPQWQNDVAIMGEFWTLHLPKAKATQINSIHTYLKITFLLKVQTSMDSWPTATSPVPAEVKHLVFPQQPQSEYLILAHTALPWQESSKQVYRTHVVQTNLSVFFVQSQSIFPMVHFETGEAL